MLLFGVCCFFGGCVCCCCSLLYVVVCCGSWFYSVLSCAVCCDCTSLLLVGVACMGDVCCCFVFDCMLFVSSIVGVLCC